MKTIAKTTIRNASKEKLIGYIADIARDLPYDGLTTEQLRRKVKKYEGMTPRWYGEKITFEEWANS